MAKEVKRGNRHSTTFSRSSWSVIKEELYEKTNKKYNHAQFRNKYNQLRIHYIWFTNILSKPGFTWEPVLGTAVANDDVWESYLKVNYTFWLQKLHPLRAGQDSWLDLLNMDHRVCNMLLVGILKTVAHNKDHPKPIKFVLEGFTAE
ncbi:Myb/SANT-like domain-containing protein [Artemisia annua]|uniref:Myb/SANT-like domain-containing protein n=1 Tax=Artemisia annua TaxID=35608 RepID=A0A2U1KL44_ARTAN|nr:Myb/SANT-like domain-containing protein [Artemisia annua]